MPTVDIDAFRDDAEQFLSALDREYYLHFSGQQDEYAIEAIYDRHADLFSRAAVDGLREQGAALLLEFAVQGLVGQETKAEAAELARREATLEVEVEGEAMPFRETSIAQANEPDADRRATIQSARDATTEEHLNPLLLELLERSGAVATELGWPSTLAMCEELSGIDLRALGAQTDAFLAATEDVYEPLAGPRIEEQLGFGFERLRRADLPSFFRAASLDRWFPAERLVPSLVETLGGMGIDIDAQSGVTLDTEQRPRKSPRAFCAPVRVPDEIYLVIARIGGRDDFAALFHEAGHTEHYAHVEPSLPAEERYLGDNSVTEAFAFLFEHLVEDPAWLSARLGLDDAAEVVRHAEAVKLVYLRRYCAKLGYELELHAAPASLEPLPGVYARRLSEAVHVDWPRATWLSDVDPFFYASRYLRAWALETHLRKELRDRFGPAWFDEPAAGEFLRGVWSNGQRMGAEALLEQLGGGELDFSVLLEDLR